MVQNSTSSNSSSNSPTLEDVPLNRIKGFIAYAVTEFNLRGPKEVLISSDKNNAVKSKYNQFIGKVAGDSVPFLGEITSQITKGNLLMNICICDYFNQGELLNTYL